MVSDSNGRSEYAMPRHARSLRHMSVYWSEWTAHAACPPSSHDGNRDGVVWSRPTPWQEQHMMVVDIWHPACGLTHCTIPASGNLKQRRCTRALRSGRLQSASSSHGTTERGGRRILTLPAQHGHGGRMARLPRKTGSRAHQTGDEVTRRPWLARAVQVCSPPDDGHV